MTDMVGLLVPPSPDVDSVCPGVFLRYGLRVMEWHHRLLEAVTSIDEAKLMQRRKYV